jgi:hypothetical protein
MLRSSDAIRIPFALFFTGVAIFWEKQTLRGGTPIFFMLWGIPFLLAGAYMLVGRFFFDMWQRRSTVYAVTPRRIFILKPGRSKIMMLPALEEINFREFGDGTGTITFGPEVPAIYFGGYSNSYKFQPAPPAFERIKNAKRVLGMITNLKNK